MGMPTLTAVSPLTIAGMLFVQSAWAQTEPQSGYFTTSNGVELHYLEAGSGPTIVFVPGFAFPAEVWEPQLTHFARNHRVVALDPRSQGRSGKPTEGLQLDREELNGQPTSGDYRWTHVLVKREGRWEAVANHVTRIQEG
jgi:pimeloyl-ACP methyl ester carboxylesterase